MAIRGGRRLARHLRGQKRKVDTANRKVIEAGMFDPRAAALASVHEFGLGNNPSRPAFRRAAPEARRAIRAHLRDLHDLPTEDDMQAAGEAAAELIRDSYRDAPGPAVGERQRERKRDTPGAGRLLVGHEGEKLIDHIEARVTDRSGT